MCYISSTVSQGAHAEVILEVRGLLQMLSTQERQAFEKIIDTLKPGSDIVKFAKPICDFLIKQGSKNMALKSNNFKPFFLEAFEDLAEKKNNWKFPEDKLEKVLELIPDNWKTSVITDDLVLSKVPEKNWSKYRDQNWIKENTKSKAEGEVPLDQIKVEVERDDDLGPEGADACFAITVKLGDISSLVLGNTDLTNDEAVDEAIDEAFSSSDLEKQLDKDLWEHLRHKFDLESTSVNMDHYPNTIEKLKDAEFGFKLALYFETPYIDPEVITEGIKKAFRWIA